MKATKIFYRVIRPSSFSNENAKSLREARKIVKDFGECPNGTPMNKEFWRKQMSLCKIVKVTEIVEEVE